ncbi:MAG: SRPBCC domain-containing protein [bacterium]|nr:SRPBCC domain-containing protein [bacterium]
MAIEFEVSETFQGSPALLFHAWLDSAEHTAMTGGEALVSDEVGGSFSAWDGYISGKNIELETGKRILQSWRTDDFDPDAPDSSLCILFQAEDDRVRVTIHHSDLPEGGMRYHQGWIDFYFEPMKAYFNSR